MRSYIVKKIKEDILGGTTVIEVIHREIILEYSGSRSVDWYYVLVV